jgi:hypothetical protein
MKRSQACVVTTNCVSLSKARLSKLGDDDKCRSIAQPGSALVWGTRGRRFKSGYSDHSSIFDASANSLKGERIVYSSFFPLSDRF